MRLRIAHNEEGDWVGLYINGKLAYEGHDLPTFDLLSEMDMAGMLHPELDMAVVWGTSEKWGEYLEKFGNRFPTDESELDL